MSVSIANAKAQSDKPPRYLMQAKQGQTRQRISQRHAGWLVLFSTLALLAVGVTSIELANEMSGVSVNYAKKQLIIAGMGLVIAFFCTIPHYKWLAYFRWPLAAITLIPLIFVLLPFVPESIVTPRNGARRWINLGLMDVQPSELVKVTYVAIMAGYLRYRDTYRRFSGLFMPAFIAFVPMSLILVEPDLGTSLLFIPALVAMLIAAGAKLSHLITTGSLAFLFAVVVIAISLVAAERGDYPLLREHQVERIQTVVGPYLGIDSDEQGRDFQASRAKTLIGAGGTVGHAPTKAAAFVHFSRLPERHNDMIFPVIVARWGFVGAVGVIGLYVLWVGGALLVAASCKVAFGRILVVGLATMVGTQAFINIGMTLGLLPITGMTLPFVSAGGSSLLAGFMMVGLIMNVAMRRPPYLWRPSFEYDGDDGAAVE